MTALRELWNDGKPTFGGWATVPSSASAEAVARVGFDYVCVDQQHGVIDYSSAVGLIQAILLGGGEPITRVPWNEPGIIGKMLDAGAMGIIVPMVNSRAEAAAVVHSARYAPVGSRSFGPIMSSMRSPDHYMASGERIAVIPMIETIEAMKNLDDILSTPGVDAIYVGPADLSVSLGLPPGSNDGRAEFDDALAVIVDACRKHGVVPGIHATGALAARRLEQGFRMITVSGDMLAMRTKMAEELALAQAAPAPSADGSIY
jgi:4-hydroxy-2-oxoheptanedioate aldolase